MISESKDECITIDDDDETVDEGSTIKSENGARFTDNNGASTSDLIRKEIQPFFESIQETFSDRFAEVKEQHKKEIDELKQVLAQVTNENIKLKKTNEHIAQQVGKRICKGCGKMVDDEFLCY